MFDIDNILVTETTEEVKLNALNEVLHCLKKAGLCLKRSKSHFILPKVVFWGHTIDAHARYASLTGEGKEAIKDVPKPRNVSEFKSYLRLLSYYTKFLPNLSTILAPCINFFRHPPNGSGRSDRKKHS